MLPNQGFIVLYTTMFSHKIEAIVLFIGDAVLLYVALFITLLVRYGLPFDQHIIRLHFLPFSVLFLLWVIVFFIAGLYERHTLLFQRRLPQLLLSTLAANGLLAVLLFYFVPSFLITPRTNLFIFLFLSFISIFLWRRHGGAFRGAGEKQQGIIVGSGEEFHELLGEVNGNPHYNLKFVTSVPAESVDRLDFEEEIARRVHAAEVSLMVVDIRDKRLGPLLPHLYNLLFSRVRFVDLYAMYEEIFGRIPLSLVEYSWFLEHISAQARSVYDFGKRLMDIALSLPLLLVPLLLSPFVFVAVKLEDGGSVFIRQRRIGKNNAVVELLKFRTMLFNDEGKWGEKSEDNRVTKVGTFLRKTRFDEFPTLWNVLTGDMSLIGPRPEFPQAVAHYTEELPYYNIRHLIKPGLSGWAQLYGEHPHHATDVLKTKNKLSYDLYYLKNRSFFLDFKIAVKTIKILLSRSGV